jgi:hypothetical protein
MATRPVGVGPVVLGGLVLAGLFGREYGPGQPGAIVSKEEAAFGSG